MPCRYRLNHVFGMCQDPAGPKEEDGTVRLAVLHRHRATLAARRDRRTVKVIPAPVQARCSSV